MRECGRSCGRAGVRVSGRAGVRRFFSTSGRADEQTNRRKEGGINARATVRFVVSSFLSVCRFAQTFSTSGRADKQTNRSAQRHCEEGYARRGNLLRLVRRFPRSLRSLGMNCIVSPPRRGTRRPMRRGSDGVARRRVHPRTPRHSPCAPRASHAPQSHPPHPSHPSHPSHSSHPPSPL